MKPRLLIVPGVGDSGPDHWQTIWQNKYAGARRAVQDNWEYPWRDDWVAGLDRALRAIEGEVVLVAHSLGCLTIAHWARTFETSAVKGSLLVAPVDLETPDYPPGVGEFTPVPRDPLPFPSILVGSTDDSHCTIDRAAEFARSWGARFANAGACGHVNPASGFGDWPAGEQLLRELLYAAEKREGVG